MTRLQKLLESCIVYGLLLVALISPTQYAVRVAKDSYVSVVDPLICLLFAAWLLWRRTKPQPAALADDGYDDEYERDDEDDREYDD